MNEWNTCFKYQLTKPVQQFLHWKKKWTNKTHSNSWLHINVILIHIWNLIINKGNGNTSYPFSSGWIWDTCEIEKIQFYKLVDFFQCHLKKKKKIIRKFLVVNKKLEMVARSGGQITNDRSKFQITVSVHKIICAYDCGMVIIISR